MSVYETQTTQGKDALYNLIKQIYSTSGSGTITETRLTLINGVKIRIDEMMPEGEGVQFDLDGITNATDTLDLAINALIDESATTMLLRANIDKINGTLSDAALIKSDPEDGTGYILLPNDYLRFQSFKLTLWEREVTWQHFFPTTDERYKKQSISFLRGGKAKPVCVLMSANVDGVYKKIIKYFSLEVGDTHTLEKFVYVPVTLAEDIQADLIEPMLWICASKTLQIMGYPVESDRAMIRAAELLDNDKI
jgi:hypothetical protein